MHQSSLSLKQLAARKAELLAESREIRNEMQHHAAALLPIVSTIETGLKIGHTLKTGGTITRKVGEICSLFLSNGA